MIKDALKQFFVYTMGSIAQTALNFALLLLYLHYFEPSDYGVISLLTVLSSLISLLVGTGFISGLFRLYYEASIEERKSLASATWIWYLSTGIIPAAILFLFPSFFSNLLFQKGDFSYSIKLLSISFLLSMIETIPFNFLRLEKRSGIFVIFSLLNLIVNFLLKYYFIAVLAHGINGYFESSIIASALMLLVVFPFVLKYVSFPPKLSHFSELLKLGYPFIFSGIAVWTLDKANRFVLNYVQGTESVGIYSLGCNFANLFNVLLLSPSALFWNPFFFSYAAKMPEQDIKKLLNKSQIYFLFLGYILFLAISLSSDDILRIFTSKTAYWQAETLIPMLVLGNLVYLLCRQAGNALLLAKRPQITSIAGLIAAVVNIGLNLLLVPVIGIFGSALSTVISYVSFLILIYWRAQTLYHVDYDWKCIVKSSIFLVIALMLSWQIRLSQPWISLFVRTTTGVVLFSLLTWFFGNILTQHERQKVILYIKHGRKQGVRKLLRRFTSKA